MRVEPPLHALVGGVDLDEHRLAGAGVAVAEHVVAVGQRVDRGDPRELDAGQVVLCEPPGDRAAHAPSRGRQKRGGAFLPQSQDSVALAAAGAFDEVLALDEAIERLAGEAPDLAEVVRLRFYAGREVAEVATAVGRSERSVARDWAYAKTRLYQLLRD